MGFIFSVFAVGYLIFWLISVWEGIRPNIMEQVEFHKRVERGKREAEERRRRAEAWQKERAERIKDLDACFGPAWKD
ncbi:MAG: hypothetical protein JO329_08045 [Planctomycetaceae bacterium]|jgi:hypothetical protein|nr:hypothetical protein [Planctomycetaceae bacterium]MBV8266580.1 hypothetical protein [Planctomycetaceae bacterium]MBV8316681.1 hypothetical protein [Planctomycetaceae bacterium]MBV8382473.1 hypothetical protein [Planctomycetaceae bacterium]MBV8609330.1 hypothetical protein [Singulisphaera sp.]